MQDHESLLALCSDSRQPSDRTDFRSSKVYAVLEDPFTLWCGFHAPREEAVQENSTYEADKSKREHELRRLWAQEHFPGFRAVENLRGRDALDLTLRLMREGAPAIQYPALWFLPKNIYGKANLIVRSDSAPSIFGNYHYTLVQLKQALEAKHHYCVQGALLNRILGLMQGFQAPRFRIFLRHKDITLEQADWQRPLEEVLDTWGAIRDNLLEPEAAKPPNAASAPWRIYANRLVAQKRDLIMLAGLSREWRNKLRDSGITDIRQAAQCGPERLRELTDEQTGTDIFGNAAAFCLAKAVARTDGALGVPVRKRNLYFDFENSDAMTPSERSYVYLIGVWDAQTGEYTSFLAKNEAGEQDVFARFADYVGDPREALLYHWTEHEAHHIKDAASRYPNLGKRMHALLPSCFDLKKAVQKAFYLPSPSFSLKAAAPAFGFSWRQQECGAMDSMALYWEWASNGDEAAIRKVLIYNEDDCLAMRHIQQRLEAGEHVSLPKARELLAQDGGSK